MVAPTAMTTNLAPVSARVLTSSAPTGAPHLPETARARVPSLDGLRGVSILAVLVAHALGTGNFLSSSVINPVVGDLGNLGVRVFFIISGFMITSLLFQEVAKSGHISLKGFYLRRTFRIFPAFYTYLAVMFTLSVLGVLHLSLADDLHAATYTVNFAHDRSWYIGHVWSLSVEEQFYLLWPVALILWLPGGRPGVAQSTSLSRAESTRRRAKWVAIAVIFIAPFARVGTWVFLPTQRALIGEAFPTIADSIAFGCLLASFRGDLDAHKGYLGFLRSRWFWLVPVAIVALNLSASHVGLFYTFGETLLDLLIAVVIDRAVRLPDGLSGRLLNSRILVHIGVLSYSIYLWQQPFLNRHSSGLFQSFPLSLIAALACAHASYYLIERPALRLRVRLFG
jgi:peptidoglycan/LPS O-acetylase OafA/YrhL